MSRPLATPVSIPLMSAMLGGQVAFHAGRRLGSNPYALASDMWRAWRQGWITAAKETVKRETSAAASLGCRHRRGHGVDWTPAELALLARLVADPRVPRKEAATILGRTPAAVKVKACRLRAASAGKARAA